MIEIRTKPLSLGRIWGQTRSGRRFLMPEGKRYKQLIGSSSQGMDWLREYNGALLFKAEFYGPWLTKKGAISKTAGDLDNFAKLLLDSLCESYGFDDSQVTEISLRKFVADGWLIRLHLEPTAL